MEAQGQYATWIAELFPRQGEWTEEAFYRLPITNQKIELSDGVVKMTPSPGDPHQNAVVNLTVALKVHVEAHKLGIVRVAPYDVRLFPGTIRQPDVLFVREEHRNRIKRTLDGPPDWVAEIVSPDDRAIDEVIKLAEYARAGIPEYWLVDPEAEMIRIYALVGDHYRLAATVTMEQIARSVTIPGFEVAVAAVFAR